MPADYSQSPSAARSWRGLLAQLLREGWANSRTTYAVSLGAVGFGLLLATMVVALHQQRSSEGDAARITPVDEQRTGQYLTEPPVEAIRPARAELASMPTGMIWAALATLVGAVVAGTLWYAIVWYQKRLLERVQQYRRTRATRPSARLAAKRRAITEALNSQGPEARKRLTVGQLMTESSVVASPAASIPTLSNLLSSSPLRHVLVSDGSGRLLGIITDRDLRHRRGKRARDVMTHNPTSVPPSAPLGLAAALMVDHQISCLPVVDDGRLRGVLTADEMVLVLDCLLRAPESHPPQTPRRADETAVLADLETLCAAVRSADTSAQPASAPPVGASS